MHPEKRELVNFLNTKTIEEKESFWFKNKRIYKSCEKDGQLEYNWFYFVKIDIWMCELHDYDRFKEGNDIISDIVFFEEKRDFKELNKQWCDLCIGHS